MPELCIVTSDSFIGSPDCFHFAGSGEKWDISKSRDACNSGQ